MQPSRPVALALSAVLVVGSVRAVSAAAVEKAFISAAPQGQALAPAPLLPSAIEISRYSELVGHAADIVEAGRHEALRGAVTALSAAISAEPYSPEVKDLLFSMSRREALALAAKADGGLGARALALHKQLESHVPLTQLRSLRAIEKAEAMAIALSNGHVLPIVDSGSRRDLPAVARYLENFAFRNHPGALIENRLAALETLAGRQRALDASIKPLMAKLRAHTGLSAAADEAEDAAIAGKSLESFLRPLLGHQNQDLRAQALARLEELIVLEAFDARDGDPAKVAKLGGHAYFLRQTAPDKDWPKIRRNLLALVRRSLDERALPSAAALRRLEEGLEIHEQLPALPPKPRVNVQDPGALEVSAPSPKTFSQEAVKAASDIVAQAADFLESRQHGALAAAFQMLNVAVETDSYSPEVRELLHSDSHRSALAVAASRKDDIGREALALKARLDEHFTLGELQSFRRHILMVPLTILMAMEKWGVDVFPKLARPREYIIRKAAYRAPRVARYLENFDFHNETTKLVDSARQDLAGMIGRQRQLDAELDPLLARLPGAADADATVQARTDDEGILQRLLRHENGDIRRKSSKRLEQLITLEAFEARDGDSAKIVRVLGHARLSAATYYGESDPRGERVVLDMIKATLGQHGVDASDISLILGALEEGFSATEELALTQLPAPTDKALTLAASAAPNPGPEPVAAASELIARASDCFEGGKRLTLARAIEVMIAAMKATPYSTEVRDFLLSARHRNGLKAAKAAYGDIGRKAELLQSLVQWHLSDASLAHKWLLPGYRDYQRNFNFYNNPAVEKKTALDAVDALLLRQRTLQERLRPLLAGLEDSETTDEATVSERGLAELLFHRNPQVRAQAGALLERLIVIESLEARDGDPRKSARLSERVALFLRTHLEPTPESAQRHLFELVKNSLEARRIDPAEALAALREGVEVGQELAQLEAPLQLTSGSGD